VPGTIQQSYPVRDTDHVVVVLVHILACQQENNQDKDSKNEMDFSQAGFLIFNGPNLSSLTDNNVRSFGVDHGHAEPKGLHGLRPGIALACGRCVISSREVLSHSMKIATVIATSHNFQRTGPDASFESEPRLRCPPSAICSTLCFNYKCESR
jgi:bacterioferritin-associated ferredoxin